MADSENTTTAGRSPAFQFYPKDFLTDENVRVMSLQERGAYITLICYCWSEGSLPADTARLARLCGTPLTTFRRLWPALERCFRPSRADASRIVHPRLERERRKQSEYSTAQSEHGKRGAAKRWQKDGGAIASPSPPNGVAIVLPMAKNGSSVFSLQTPVKKAERGGEDPKIQAIASQLSEIYPEVYAAARTGAVYRTTGATFERDWPNYYAAAELHPDIARLRRLLEIFLTRPFGDRSSPGTPGQFVNMLPECDEVLRRSGWKVAP